MELEYAKEDDHFYDYCLGRYIPATEYVGKLGSANLAYHFFHFMNYDVRFFELASRIRHIFGSNRTVWGIKKIDDRFFMELYFYNWGRGKEGPTVTRFLESLEMFFSSGIQVDESLNYHMFSVDLMPQYLSRRELPEIHVYIDYSGYLFTQNEISHENYYSFYSPQKELSSLIRSIEKSAFVTFKKIDLKEILIPRFLDCGRICRAHKKHSDGIYFSRIKLDQFLFFLEKFDYPSFLISFIEDRRSLFDHLLFDIGYDYTMENKELRITKSGYYGTL